MFLEKKNRDERIFHEEIELMIWQITLPTRESAFEFEQFQFHYKISDLMLGLTPRNSMSCMQGEIFRGIWSKNQSTLNWLERQEMNWAQNLTSRFTLFWSFYFHYLELDVSWKFKMFTIYLKGQNYSKDYFKFTHKYNNTIFLFSRWESNFRSIFSLYRTNLGFMI